MKVFKTKKDNKKKYKIVFCDQPDIATKFGEYDHNYDTFDEAEWAINSKANGWGKAIQYRKGDFYKIDDCWLTIIEE